MASYSSSFASVTACSPLVTALTFSPRNSSRLDSVSRKSCRRRPRAPWPPSPCPFPLPGSLYFCSNVACLRPSRLGRRWCAFLLTGLAWNMPIRHFYFQGEITRVFSLKMQKEQAVTADRGNALKRFNMKQASADLFLCGPICFRSVPGCRRRNDAGGGTAVLYTGKSVGRPPAAATRRDPARIEHEHTRIGGKGQRVAPAGAEEERGRGAAGRGRPEAGVRSDAVDQENFHGVHLAHAPVVGQLVADLEQHGLFPLLFSARVSARSSRATSSSATAVLLGTARRYREG